MYGENRPELNTLKVGDKITYFHYSNHRIREFRTVAKVGVKSITDNFGNTFRMEHGRKSRDDFRSGHIEVFIPEDEKNQELDKEELKATRRRNMVVSASLYNLTQNVYDELYVILKREGRIEGEA